MQGGLKLFGIKEENVSAMTAFRLAMVHRPRFTALLYPPTQSTSATFGFLLGDAANEIHFWPGRGLNSGTRLGHLAGAVHDVAVEGTRISRSGFYASRRAHGHASISAQEPGLARHGDDRRHGDSVRDQEQDQEGAG